MSDIIRKLASVRTVKAVRPIPDADLIELALIDGWQCIVKKGEFAPGDLCVYFEIDSFLPERDEFEFLRKSSYRKMGEQGGFRIRTMKMRGVLSQGLALPIMPEERGMFSEGDDVTDMLGVKKWEPPIPAQLAGQAKGKFPSYIHKTDQERIQNVYDKLVARYADHDFEATVKMDGTSCTFFRYRPLDEDGVCGRNIWFKDNEDNDRNSLVKEWRNHKDLVMNYPRNLAFQGEVVGNGIQGNPHKVRGQKFFLFDIFDIDAGRYIQADERRRIAVELGIEHVRIVAKAMRPLKIPLADLLKMAEDEGGEGIVFKSLQDPSVSFKVINNNYLLKHKD